MTSCFKIRLETMVIEVDYYYAIGRCKAKWKRLMTSVLILNVLVIYTYFIKILNFFGVIKVENAYCKF